MVGTKRSGGAVKISPEDIFEGLEDLPGWGGGALAYFAPKIHSEADAYSRSLVYFYYTF